MNSPTGQTRQRIFTLDDSNDEYSRNGVPFVGFVDTALHLWVKSPENPNFGAWIGVFQTKQAKYWKFHVIEITASILTKFGITNRDHQVVIKGGPNRRPTNLRWRTAAIKTVKSPYLCNRSTDFDEIWQGDAYWPLQRINR